MNNDKIDRRFDKNTYLHNVQEILDRRLADVFSYT